MSEANDKKSNFLEIVLYLFIGILILAYFIFVGLNKEAFQESFVQGQALIFGSYLVVLITYLSLMLVAFGNIIFPLVKSRTLRPSQHPATTPNPKWHRIFSVSWLYSVQENSLLYNLNLKNKGKNIFAFLKNPLKVFLIGILLFTPFALILAGGQTQLAIAGVPNLNLAQQITPQSEFSSGALLPSFAENGLLLFFFSLFSGLIAFALAKFGNRSKVPFFLLIFLLCIMMGFMFAGFHKIVSANSDVSQIGHFIFGFFGTFLTLLSGSFVLFLLLHILNNSGLIINTLASSNDAIRIGGWIVWAVLLLITLGVIFYNKSTNKKTMNGIPN